MSGGARALGPGATAIEAAVVAADGPVAARHHPRAPQRFRGRGPLGEVIVTRPQGHWHLVTLGLSELGSKESPDPSVSGWGFELTFRVVSDQEPLWAVELLASLAGYVWSTRRSFAPGHHVELGGPLHLGSTTCLSAAMVVRDPGLGALHGPFGELEALQLLGLTADELEAATAVGNEAVVEVLARGNPLLVTDLERGSAIAGLPPPPARSGPIVLEVGTLGWSLGRRGRVSVELGAGAAATLGRVLGRALRRPGGTLRLVGGELEVVLSAGEPAGCEPAGQVLVLSVPPDQIEDFAARLGGPPGSYCHPAWPRLTWRVVP